MRATLVTVATALALLVPAAAASGSSARPHGSPAGVVPHTASRPGSAQLRLHAAPQAVGFTTPTFQFPANYSTFINQYFADVAHDSGGSANVYSVDPQYTDGTGPAAYSSSFGGAVVAHDPLPANGCDDGVGGPGTGDPVCLTDAQLQTEVQNVMTSNGWTGGLTHMFFLMTPNGVGSCVDGTPAYTTGECSTNFFCAYHSYFGTPSQPVIYANEPFEFAGCNDTTDGQGFPNDPNADTTISTISHEHNEAITDPLTDNVNNGWLDSSGNEIGDDCAYTYGTALGQFNGQNYNQLINGDHYSIQEEWSNADATTLPNGCVQRLGGVASPDTLAIGTPPLVYQGGPVMHSNTTYAIYWLPTAGNVAAPTVSGTPIGNQTLTSSTGTWTGAPTGYAYQWQRCSSTGSGCVNIPGATGSTYTLTSADGNQTIRSTVSATNVNGASAYVPSATTAVVLAVPAATSTPVVSGLAAVGKFVSVTPGTWNTPVTFAYQWQRCSATGSSCAAIAGATSSSYAIGAADAGHTLRAVVSGTNAAGTGSATSAATAVVIAKPASTHGPTISGKAKSGHSLKANAGVWSGSPTFAYQWLRCNAKGAGCAAIHRASKPTYRVGSHDVGHRLRVRVTARNRAGSTVATSAATAKVHS